MAEGLPPKASSASSCFPASCIAPEAKAPIVPIVFRNTLDVLPKHGIVLRPATVEVVVHKPLATANWKRKDLDRHIGEVYQLFEKTLAA